MIRLIALAVLLSIISQCDKEPLINQRDKEPLISQRNKDVAELSFADSSPLTKEVQEVFDVVVKVSNIDFDNLSDNLNWHNLMGEPDDKQYEVDKDKRLYVTLQVMREGDSEPQVLGGRYCVARGAIDTTLVENGVATFSDYCFVKTCEACRLVAGLRVYSTMSGCAADSGCAFAAAKPVAEVSRTVTITSSSYAMQVEKLNDKNVKLTVTKNDKPLANQTAFVNIGVPCEEPVQLGMGCHKPRDTSLISKEITLDANGSWSTELDADGSWLAEAGEDYEFDVCKKVTVAIKVDDRKLKAQLANSAGCSS